MLFWEGCGANWLEARKARIGIEPEIYYGQCYNADGSLDGS